MLNNNQPTQDDGVAPEQVANRFGIAALILASMLAVYYALVLTGEQSQPPLGVVPLLAGAIMLCATVKICHWAVSCTVERAVDRRMQEVEERHAGEIRTLTAAVQDLTTALLHDGDQAARSTLERTQDLIHATGRASVSPIRARQGS